MSIVHHFGYWQLSWPRSYLKYIGKESLRPSLGTRLMVSWPGAHGGVWAWSVNELWWPDPGTVSILVAACSVHFQWTMHQTVSIIMPSGLIRCRPPVLTTIYQPAGWEHCHMSRDTSVVTRSHALATSLACPVEFPQSTSLTRWPGTHSDILHSILIWQHQKSLI